MSNFLYFGDDLSVYREIPVDIDTFIEEDYFIGKYTRSGKSIYPFWRNMFRRIFNIENPARNIVVSTAVGTGKTRFCNIAFSYSLYLFMCLKNPIEFFKLMPEDKLVFAICGVDSTYTEQSLQCVSDVLCNSDWFKSHGEFIFDDDPKPKFKTYKPLESNIVLDTVYKECDLFGHRIIGYNSSWLTDKYKGRCMEDICKSIEARLISYTSIDNKQYGLGFIDVENNCADGYMQNIWTRYPENYFTISGSQWDIKPHGTFSNDRFAIITDRIWGHSKAIDLVPEQLRDIPDGYDIILIPKEFRRYAELDPDQVLNELAGIRIKKDTKESDSEDSSDGE